MKRNKKASTKVVVRHLPPSLSRSHFFGLIDSVFGDRYGWSSFRLGKIGRQTMIGTRHGFSEEGIKLDNGTYLEFLKFIAKPDNLRKPAVQLEATEVEQAEEIPVVTPVMEFVRQKRAGHGVQDVSAIRKISGKAHKVSNGKLASVTIKHGRAKTKNALEDSKKDAGVWDKSENSKRNPKLRKKNVLLLKGKEVEVSEGGMSSIVNSTVLIASKQSNLRENREEVIQTILLNNETRQSYPNVPPKKIKPKILDSRKQRPQHSDLESSVTCNVPKYVKKTTGDQFVSKEHHAADNIHEKPVKHKEVIGVRSRSINGENLPPSTGRNISCQEDGSKRYFSHHRHNTKNDYYRRKDNGFINRTDVRNGFGFRSHLQILENEAQWFPLGS